VAKLSAKKRKSLPKSAFAYPSKRAYPIHDKAHARAALSRAAQKKTSGSYAGVAAAVNRRYPGLAKGKKKGSTGRKRSSTRRTARRRR
jgi:type IV secretory pathway VirB9-like protein